MELKLSAIYQQPNVKGVIVSPVRYAFTHLVKTIFDFDTFLINVILKPGLQYAILSFSINGRGDLDGCNSSDIKWCLSGCGSRGL